MSGRKNAGRTVIPCVFDEIKTFFLIGKSFRAGERARIRRVSTEDQN